MKGLQIACDESGYEGEKLIGTTTDVFAHAGVRLPADLSAACLAELRQRIRSPATEYKANHLLREKHRAVLVWFLGPSSPLFRNAHVYVIDKVCYVLGKLADLVFAEPDAPGLSTDRRARTAADRLYRWAWAGQAVAGRADAATARPVQELLVAANDLMRGKDRDDVAGPVDAFFAALDREDDAGGIGGETGARDKAVALRVRMKNDPSLSILDPLIPALVRAVARWGGGGRPVTIVHDRQTMLPGERVAELQRVLRRSGMTLERVELAAAETEPRVQLADILAGTVRKITQDELHGHGDAELITLARPYLDPYSIWGDRRSWARLHGRPTADPDDQPVDTG
ncbi:hypothetical protein [Pseudosporangium ferrugineum]|uniref:DUF3800 domain-containing protein n=1 Tax=Pseudosporangium ferrugineum TaxID=439699 RepID=A0A2T0SFU7_9ACTN|nr:hypothetical protein [Pseudosporangium ferrugineum]PRY32277.1 hypothetical protein CLV70_102488 [Pseudosporangium ferrugineum]